jgi:hypothetical protein
MENWVKAVISSFVAAIAAGLTAAVKHLYSKQKAQEAEQTAIRDGMLALLHDRIFSIYGECKQKKHATVEDIRNLDYLYQPYHRLGGNGTGTELYERVKKMPAEPAEQEIN